MPKNPTFTLWLMEHFEDKDGIKKSAKHSAHGHVIGSTVSIVLDLRPWWSLDVESELTEALPPPPKKEAVCECPAPHDHDDDEEAAICECRDDEEGEIGTPADWESHREKWSDDQ